MEELSLHLELPFNTVEAESRGIDPSLCKLVCECKTKDSRICISVLVKAIDKCIPIGDNTFITSVGEFVSIGIIQAVDDIEIIESSNLVNTKTKDALENVIAKWNAEALVIFFCDAETAKTIISNVESIEKAWWRYRKGGSYDESFVSQIKLCGLFIFYASTHQSLEMIGHEDQISKCYECLKKWGQK